MADFINRVKLRKPTLNEMPTHQIDIIQPFWGNQLPVIIKGLTHPIITYADLIETGDPRNLETANLIREKYID